MYVLHSTVRALKEGERDKGGVGTELIRPEAPEEAAQEAAEEAAVTSGLAVVLAFPICTYT